MNKSETINQVFRKRGGIFQLLPAWVPRAFCRPGKRIKLHPDDYYALGLERGGIDERWLSSTTQAYNGPDTPGDEGLSYVVDAESGGKFLLKDSVDALGEKAVGTEIWDKYRAWPMFSKFFDNAGPLPHHVHHNDEFAGRISRAGKPEMYFFPPQLNNHGGEFPFTFFGIDGKYSKEDVKQCLMNFTKGDNRLLDLSRAYKLTLDTGWDVPPGVLHAPGSLCTYEPQFASDVYAMYQSVLYGGYCVPENLLWNCCPEDETGNFDYLISVLDWELNTDKDFLSNRYMTPVIIKSTPAYTDEWICYKSDMVCAKRLTVRPKQTAVIKDAAAYGMICVQGCGSIGEYRLETPALIRYGQATADEFFITYEAAENGVRIKNDSNCEDIVILKHYAVNNELLKTMKSECGIN